MSPLLWKPINDQAAHELGYGGKGPATQSPGWRKDHYEQPRHDTLRLMRLQLSSLTREIDALVVKDADWPKYQAAIGKVEELFETCAKELPHHVSDLLDQLSDYVSRPRRWKPRAILRLKDLVYRLRKPGK